MITWVLLSISFVLSLTTSLPVPPAIYDEETDNSVKADFDDESENDDRE